MCGKQHFRILAPLFPTISVLGSRDYSHRLHKLKSISSVNSSSSEGLPGSVRQPDSIEGAHLLMQEEAIGPRDVARRLAFGKQSQ